jgi:hypothetical protein
MKKTAKAVVQGRLREGTSDENERDQCKRAPAFADSIPLHPL